MPHLVLEYSANVPDQPDFRRVLLDLHDALVAHYAASVAAGGWVSVEPAPESGKLDATALNDTNKLELRVFANEAHRQAVLMARLDNLGKGASGAAVQAMNVHLGVDEGLGL